MLAKALVALITLAGCGSVQMDPRAALAAAVACARLALTDADADLCIERAFDLVEATLAPPDSGSPAP